MDGTNAKDSDRLYRAVSIPWMSPYGLAIEIGGQGFLNIFDELHHLKMLKRRSIQRNEWEFVGLWRPRFPGERPMTLLVFRRRAG